MLRKRQNINILMLTVLASAFGLRLFHLTYNSMWLDEAYSYFLSILSLKQIVYGTMLDQHPPLFYVLLHFWMFLGHDAFTLRLFSVMIGVISIAVLYKIGSRLISPQVGLLAAVFLTISPIHIWYSQEVRMYALLTLFSIISIYLCWSLLNKPQRWFIWAGFVVVNLAALYTHNMAVFILIFENLIWLTILFTKNANKPVWKWLLAQTIIFLGYVPWLPIVFQQTTQHPMTWIPHPTPALMGNMLIRLAFGGKWLDNVRNYLELEVIFLLIIVIAVLILRRKQQYWQPMLFNLLWFLFPFIFITLISFKVSIYQEKQFLFLAPALSLIFATSILNLKFPLLKGGMVLVIIGLTWSPLYDQYFIPQKVDWRLIAQFIDKNVQSGDIIYLSAASSGLPLSFYLTRQDIPQNGYPHIFDFEKGGWDGQKATPDIINSQMSSLVDSYNRVWLIDYGSEFWDSQGLIPAWLDARCQILGKDEITNVKIGLYNTNQCY